MRVLPERTVLPTEILVRTHAPPGGKYTTFRNCCRWDFGFTCALCFLHEADLAEEGAEGTGLLWIQHVAAQATHRDKADDYTNCLFSCRYCNNGRRSIPQLDPDTGAVLLDPTAIAWGSVFDIEPTGTLSERDGADRNPVYTRRTYSLDDPRKAKLRTRRAKWFAELRKCEDDVIAVVPGLLAMAETVQDLAEKETLERAAAAILEAYELAYAEIERYRAVPADAPSRCRCTSDRTLPKWLALQAQTLARYP